MGRQQRTNTSTAMMTPTEFHAMLKRRAKRLLLKGDVERYLSTLRELYELRLAERRLVA